MANSVLAHDSKESDGIVWLSFLEFLAEQQVKMT